MPIIIIDKGISFDSTENPLKLFKWKYIKQIQRKTKILKKDDKFVLARSKQFGSFSTKRKVYNCYLKIGQDPVPIQVFITNQQIDIVAFLKRFSNKNVIMKHITAVSYAGY